MSLLSEDIEKAYRTTSELRRCDTEFGTSLLNETAHRASLTDSGKVSLHVSHETWHTRLTECLGKDLQGYGLSCSCSTGNKSMAVSHLAAY